MSPHCRSYRAWLRLWCATHAKLSATLQHCSGVPLACWGWTSSNARDLLHAVSRGSGFRIALVYTVHTSIATGFTATGRGVAWEEGVREAVPKGPLELTPEHLK